MKKLSIKRRNKQAPPSRITNDTVAEHRERILAGGKRFKYPLQYTRHKLVINTIIISVVAIVALALLGWWQLYIAQNSNSFFYRISQIVPLPVAKIDGEQARFSDYLLNYRPSEHYLSKYDEISSDSDDGKLQLQYKKREALDVALADAYARKVARDHKVTVSQESVDEVIARQQVAANGQLTEGAVATATMRLYDLSPSDFETLMRNALLRTEAAFAIDEEAKATAEQAKPLIDKYKGDLEKAAADLNKQRKDSAEYGISGLVSISSSVAGIRAADVAKLERGSVSNIIRGITGGSQSDGYYYVRLLEKSATQVSFAYLHIPLTTFDEQLEALKTEGKVREYITIDIDQPEAEEEQ